MRESTGGAHGERRGAAVVRGKCKGWKRDDESEEEREEVCLCVPPCNWWNVPLSKPTRAHPSDSRGRFRPERIFDKLIRPRPPARQGAPCPDTSLFFSRRSSLYTLGFQNDSSRFCLFFFHFPFECSRERSRCPTKKNFWELFRNELSSGPPQASVLNYNRQMYSNHFATQFERFTLVFFFFLCIV